MRLYFSSPKRRVRLCNPPCLLLNGYRGYVRGRGLKCAGHGIDQPSPPSAEVKNESSYTFPLPLRHEQRQHYYLLPCRGAVNVLSLQRAFCSLFN